MSHGRPVFVLARAIGEAFVARDVELGDVEAVLGQALDDPVISDKDAAAEPLAALDQARLPHYVEAK